MQKAVLTALLVLTTAGGAVADDLSSRFNDDFGDTPPAPSAQPAPSASPAPTASPSPNPVPPVVPKPKHRPPPHDAAPVAAPPAAAAKAPVTAKPVRPPPAAAVVTPSGPAPAEYQVGISWNPIDPGWDGMYVANNGQQPLSVVRIQLNDRNDCQLKPYVLSKVQRAISLQQAAKKIGSVAINLFGLPKMEPDGVLIPELPPDLQDPGISSEGTKLKAGDRIAIINGTKCSKVVSARVDTDAGSISIKFKRPYTGH